MLFSQEDMSIYKCRSEFLSKKKKKKGTAVKKLTKVTLKVICANPQVDRILHSVDEAEKTCVI